MLELKKECHTVKRAIGVTEKDVVSMLLAESKGNTLKSRCDENKI